VVKVERRDEHMGRDKYVTVVIDLTPSREDTAPRLLDMVEGRSKQAFKPRLAGKALDECRRKQLTPADRLDQPGSEVVAQFALR
jgi:hypothetical protein